MKRMICVMLALIMLLSVMPVSASAAGKSVSESAITVLKNLQDYTATCTHISGTEYRIGYGTICTERGTHGATHDGFNETKADKALRTKLKELDTAVNNFASANGLSLSQGQHDALVVFSYDIGTGWLNGSGVLRRAVLNGYTGNALLNAFGQSADFGKDLLDKISGAERRMIEGNMYLNGVYSSLKPESYNYVKYNANGGVMAEGSNGVYIEYFDGNLAAAPAPVPTKAGNIFLGWYQDNGLTWVPKLAYLQSTTNQTTRELIARWQPVGASYTTAARSYNWLAPSALASYTIFDNPDSKKSVGTFSGDKVMIDADYIDKDGARWGKLMDKTTWVLVQGSAGTSSKFDIDVTVTVTNDFLRRRVNASVSSAENGSYTRGDQLRIVSTENGSGLLWGQVADYEDNVVGWVALMYTNWNEVKDNPDVNNAPEDIVAKAVVNCQGYLNVRSEAGTDNAIVGALADGDHVDIYQIKFVNGHRWGRTSNGWILLTYAKVTMLASNGNGNMDDVLSYTFTGKLNKAVTAYTDISATSDTIGNQLNDGDKVAVSMIKNDTDGNIWGFNGIGWIKLADIDMDAARYVVVASSVTVRSSASNGAASVDKLAKGVELEIKNTSDLKVVDATIWGYTDQYKGWVNLASKYVTRSNVPNIENVDSSNVQSGLIATVINTDSVNVRNTGATYGKVIGSLSRGTTVRVWLVEGSGEEYGWYKLDTNKNGTYDYEEDGWVAAKYLGVDYGTLDDGNSSNSSSSNSSSNGTTNAGPVETGMGIIANTYSGVNIRQGAGTGYAVVGKYLNGTSVEILEVTSTATAKWGRTAKGWVSMDYVTMIATYPIGNAAAPSTPTGPNAGGSTSTTTGNTTVSSTPAVYTGTVTKDDVELKKTADVDALEVGTLNAGDNITLQELVKTLTKETTVTGNVVDGNVTTETSSTVTSVKYWARVNGGWIEDPANNLNLDALDETTYTVTGASDINVRESAPLGNVKTTLDKGTQVKITNLQIVEDKVWGYIEDLNGWVRLDNLSQGAHTIQTNTNTSNGANNGTTNNPLNNMGNGSDVGGFVGNTAGYRYTGKVINTNQVNVRAGAGTGYAVTTQLKAGAALVIYETTIAENMAWGRCDAGWIYLYYVDLTPVTGAVDARVVYNDNTIIYTDMNCSEVAGTYARMSVIDILEIVGNMARTNQGWVSTNDLL